MFGLKKGKNEDSFEKKIEKITYMLENAKDTDFNDVYDYCEQSLRNTRNDYQIIMEEALNKYAKKSIELLREVENRNILSEIVEVKMRFFNLIKVSNDSIWSEYFEYCNTLIRK